MLTFSQVTGRPHHGGGRLVRRRPKPGHLGGSTWVRQGSTWMGVGAVTRPMVTKQAHDRFIAGQGWPRMACRLRPET